MFIKLGNQSGFKACAPGVKPLKTGPDSVSLHDDMGPICHSSWHSLSLCVLTFTVWLCPGKPAIGTCSFLICLAASASYFSFTAHRTTPLQAILV